MKIKKHKIFLFIFDIIMINTTFYLAVWIKDNSGYFGPTKHVDINCFLENVIITSLIISITFLSIFILNNLYNYNVLLYPVRSFVITIKSLLIGNIIFITNLFILKYPFISERWIILLNFLFMVFIICLFRILLLSFLLKFAISKNIIGKRLIIIGAGTFGITMAKSMLNNRTSYYTPIGFFDDKVKNTNLAIPVLGSIQDINNHHNKFDEIIIAINNTSYEVIHSIIEKCKTIKKPLHIISDLYGIVPLKKGIEEFDIVHAFSVSNIDQGLFYKTVKRIFDIIAALIFILFFLPVWILIAIIIKVNSKGPIFYKQEVIGQNEGTFIWYKFRTMIHNADDSVHRQMIKDMASGIKKDGKKLQNDDRITSVGKVLRKFSIDEFPQLISILQGNMSLVGPRPMAEYELRLLQDWQKTRFKVIPGITGPWQVLGRNDVGFNDQLVLDRYYVENQSLLLDFEILLKTIPVVLLGRGGS
tara:strand:- start:523 stop:1944 length:1422 start_codon:yes stop_codon:yes gene_type:complete